MVSFDSAARRLPVGSTWRKTAVFTVVVLAMLALSAASAPADEDSRKVNAAATLIKAGKLNEAETRLWDVLTRHPENAQALDLLGSIRLQQKRWAESETLLRRAISLAPDLLPAYINLARVFRAQGETDKEVAELQEAARLAPSDAEVNCGLAAAYLKQNDFRHALDALERIPRAHRPDAALPLLAASYLGLGRVTDAQSLAPAVTARAAKNPGLRVEFAKVLLDFDFTDNALALLEIAQKQQAPTAELFFALGRARERKGELKLAQKDYQRAIDLSPTSVDALQGLARMLAGQEQWAKSVELLSRARVVAPDSPDVLRKFAAASLACRTLRRCRGCGPTAGKAASPTKQRLCTCWALHNSKTEIQKGRALPLRPTQNCAPRIPLPSWRWGWSRPACGIFPAHGQTSSNP